MTSHAPLQPETNPEPRPDEPPGPERGSGGDVRAARAAMEALVAALPEVVKRFMARRGTAIAEWGCASGDGADVLGGAFPDGRVTGIDRAAAAVASASRRFPRHEFVHHTGDELPRTFDVVVTAGGLERRKNPLAVVLEHLARCRGVYAALVPYDEAPLADGHRAQFRDESFPARLGGFERVFTTRVDAGDPPAGRQRLLAVYASPAAQADLVGAASPLRPADRVRELLARLEQAAKLRATGTAADRELDRWLLDARVAVASLEDPHDRESADGTEAAELRRRLALIERSLAWRVTRAVCRAVDLVAPPGTLLHGIGVAVARVLASPLRLAGGLWRAIGPTRRMTWYGFAFDRYRRRRLEHHGDDLDGVAGPQVAGLVSIVLPVYNGADYVAESIDSVLAQTYENFELIIVDDGSTDATPEIVAGLAAGDPRIRTITQRNQRLPRALTNGLSAARGEFLTWTSADNRLRPEFLARMVDCLRRHPSWDMAWANVDIIDADGEPLRESDWYSGYQRPAGSEHVHFPTDPSELNVWPNNYVGAAFLYRGRVRQLLGDYSPWRFGLEDYDYWMRVNELLKLRHTDFTDPVYEYRFHGASLTARDEELGITRDRQRLMVFDEFRRDFCLMPLTWVFGPGGGAVAGELRARVAAAGHMVVELDDVDAATWPPAWVPAVFVAFEGAAPPASLPEPVLRVRVDGDDNVRAEDWDLHVLRGRAAPLEVADRRAWITVPDARRLFTAIDVRCRSDQLARIEDLVESCGDEPLDATVVVCTYQRSDQLVRALQSVASQRFDADRFEVIIVDNGPHHAEIAAVVDDCRDRFFAGGPALRAYHCPLLGLSYARNVGLGAARGRCVLFLDDDAIAAPDWVAAMVAAFDAHPDAGVIGGRILLRDPDPQPRWYRDGWRALWSHFDPGYRRYTVTENWWRFPWGANWGARRRALLQAGGFRTKYGRVGSDFGGGEEIVGGELVRRLGWKVAVEPASSVTHDVARERFSLEHVRKTIRAAAHVNYQAQRDLYTPMDPRIYLRVVAACRDAVAGMLARRADRYDRWRAWAQLAAALSVFRRQLADRLRLWRRPISTRR